MTVACIASTRSTPWRIKAAAGPEVPPAAPEQEASTTDQPGLPLHAPPHPRVGLIPGALAVGGRAHDKNPVDLADPLLHPQRPVLPLRGRDPVDPRVHPVCAQEDPQVPDLLAMRVGVM